MQPRNQHKNNVSPKPNLETLIKRVFSSSLTGKLVRKSNTKSYQDILVTIRDNLN